MKRIPAQWRKVVLAIAAVAFTVGFGAGVAWAQNPHFIDSKTRAVLQSDGDLAVSFKEAGLGDTATDYLLHALASVTCTCVTKSGNCPNAANKVTFTSDESTEGTFSPKNGTVSATLVITAPECPSSAPPTCGGGQTLDLSAIAYTNISLTDTTHSVTAGALPASVGPVTFFNCP